MFFCLLGFFICWIRGGRIVLICFFGNEYILLFQKKKKNNSIMEISSVPYPMASCVIFYLFYQLMIPLQQASTHYTILNLDNNTFIRKGRSYSSFFNFAYATILSRNIHQPITLARFLLNFHACGFHTNLPYSHFTIWVNIVVQRGLEHLHIEIPHALELPKALF